jgi:hypothetical protein
MVSISDALDGAWITFACPNCGLENDCRFQQAALEERVHCRGCHETIQLVNKDASTVTAKRQIHSALNHLRKALKRLQ